MLYSYRIEQAIRAAAVLHRDQNRKGKAPYPYVTHLYSVALILADYTDDEDTIIAGLLHDTLEDTEYSAEELEEDFGARVRTIVEAVTKPRLEELASGNVWREMHTLYTARLKDAPDEALLVAAADKIHNMRSAIEEYYEDYARFKRDFGGTLNERVTVYQTIGNTLNSRLESEIVHEYNHVFEEFKKFIHDAEKNSR